MKRVAPILLLLAGIALMRLAGATERQAPPRQAAVHLECGAGAPLWFGACANRVDPERRGAAHST